MNTDEIARELVLIANLIAASAPDKRAGYGDHPTTPEERRYHRTYNRQNKQTINDTMQDLREDNTLEDREKPGGVSNQKRKLTRKKRYPRNIDQPPREIDRT